MLTQLKILISVKDLNKISCFLVLDEKNKNLMNIICLKPQMLFFHKIKSLMSLNVIKLEIDSFGHSEWEIEKKTGHKTNRERKKLTTEQGIAKMIQWLLHLQWKTVKIGRPRQMIVRLINKFSFSTTKQAIWLKISTFDSSLFALLKWM